MTFAQGRTPTEQVPSCIGIETSFRTFATTLEPGWKLFCIAFAYFKIVFMYLFMYLFSRKAHEIRGIILQDMVDSTLWSIQNIGSLFIKNKKELRAVNDKIAEIEKARKQLLRLHRSFRMEYDSSADRYQDEEKLGEVIEDCKMEINCLNRLLVKTRMQRSKLRKERAEMQQVVKKIQAEARNMNEL